MASALQGGVDTGFAEKPYLTWALQDEEESMRQRWEIVESNPGRRPHPGTVSQPGMYCWIAHTYLAGVRGIVEGEG